MVVGDGEEGGPSAGCSPLNTHTDIWPLLTHNVVHPVCVCVCLCSVLWFPALACVFVSLDES